MRIKLCGEHEAEVLLFRDVKNAKQIVEAMLRGQFNAAFVNPNLLPELYPLMVAVDAAMKKDGDGNKVTKNVYTEIIYNLSPSRNISTALKTFSINDKSQAFVAVIPNPSAQHADVIRSAVEGTECDDVPSSLKSLSDIARIREVYAIDSLEHKTSSTVDSVITRMACRDLK